MSDRTHYVYEVYDADGVCLYVGCTSKPKQRRMQHMSSSRDARGWFGPFVSTYRMYGPYPIDVALRIESERIRAFDPIWNGHALGNLHKNRAAIRRYLHTHRVRFVRGERPNEAVLVPSSGRGEVFAYNDKRAEVPA